MPTPTRHAQGFPTPCPDKPIHPNPQPIINTASCAPDVSITPHNDKSTAPVTPTHDTSTLMSHLDRRTLQPHPILAAPTSMPD